MAIDKLKELSGIRIITKKDLSQLVPYSMHHIKRLEDKGQFPKRIQLGENRVGWILCEVENWIRSKMAERQPVAPRPSQSSNTSQSASC